MRRCWIAVAVLAASAAACAQDDGSLGEQARSARMENASVATTPAAGRVVKGEYQNEVIGLSVKQLPQWLSMSRGEMNVSEANMRVEKGGKGAIHSGYKVFGMQDFKGASLFVSVTPLPAGTDTRNLKAELQGPMKAQLPDAKFSDEPVTLSDATHPFTSFRITYKMNDKPVYQSEQIVVKNGFLVGFLVTANSPEELTATWQALKPNITWTN